MSHHMATLIAAVAVCAAAAAPAAARTRQPAAETIVYYDLTPLFALDLNDPAQRRRFWDETHLVVSLQGLVNRTAPRLFIRCLKDPDDFWWGEMTHKGAWLGARKVERIASLPALLARFRRYYRGAVVWDERVPATSNLASTIAGCDNLLCLRMDKAEGSLYRHLTGEGAPAALPVKVSLLRQDGSPLFTGAGAIPNTSLPSTGSAKCDAYLWLAERYLKTGKANPQRMGYYLDGFWLQCWKAGAPENHTLTNQDFVIARRGVLFDLNVWDDEAPVDDPGQKPGTDADTLRRLLRAAYDGFKGNGVIQAAGFVPWGYKYTDWHDSAWSAGGKHEPVATEWKYAEILSCFNAYMDADALGLSAMANASFYQHYPLAARYPQNPRPTRESLKAQGILDGEGRIVPRHYIAHYVGDYDSAAWLYRSLPSLWRDPAHGSIPLSWAFNPNLSDRFAFGMAWAREHRKPADWFVAGDVGAGYLNPGWLTPPRPHSGLPSGMAAWERHCTRLYRQWDLTLTGFIIDGNGPPLAPEGWDAYARFSPDGIVGQKVPPLGMHGSLPFIQMRTDLYGSPAEVAGIITHMSGGLAPTFMVCRSILQRPSWYADVQADVHRQAGDSIRFVDLYTLLWLVREHERERAAGTGDRWSRAARVEARPGSLDGLAPAYNADGPWEDADRAGARCWRVPAHQPPYYLYFDVAEGFHRAGGGPLEVDVQYLDEGRGRVLLQYDSTDSAAPMGGAYKDSPDALVRAGGGGWRTVTFRVPDARFGGMQNGAADLRLFNDGDDLLVRAVTVRHAR